MYHVLNFRGKGALAVIEIRKTEEFASRNIPFGVVEVRYGPESDWQVDEFRALAEREIEETRAKYTDYERKAVFGENPYVRFFKKFKKTYPVLLQFESMIIKRQPFPFDNPVTEVPYLLELTTCVLSGTHDVDKIMGAVELSSGTEKEPFVGIHGRDVHTYPGDMVARDGGGIIISEIAGADDRTCARPESRHVIYPVFSTPDMSTDIISGAIERLLRYVKVLDPAAETETAII